MQRRQFLRAVFLVSSGLPVALTTTSSAGSDLPPVKLRDLYNKDLSFSPLANSLAGKRIAVRGYMAPPLKADSQFFVLTRRPMSVCPFCETDADWPDDILAIHTKRAVETIPFNVEIVTRGQLELGRMKDADTGFVSRVRLTNASYGRA